MSIARNDDESVIDDAATLQALESAFWSLIGSAKKSFDAQIEQTKAVLFDANKTSAEKSAAMYSLLRIKSDIDLLPASTAKPLTAKIRKIYRIYTPTSIYGNQLRKDLESTGKRFLGSADLSSLLDEADKAKESSLALYSAENDSEKLRAIRDQSGITDAEERYRELISKGVFDADVSAELDRLEAEMEQLHEDFIDPIVNDSPAARSAELKAAEKLQEAKINNAMNLVYARVMESSTISTEEASIWSQAQYISPAASARLKANGYSTELARRDLAEFYRLTGGRLDRVSLQSVAGDSSENRSHALVVDGQIFVDNSFNRQVLFHEAAHLLERDPMLRSMAQAFIAGRADSSQPKKLSALTGDDRYQDSELALPDSFYDAYVGKLYRDGFTEVMAMGVQQFSSPQRMRTLLEKDPELFNIMLGVFLSKGEDTEQVSKEAIHQAKTDVEFYQKVAELMDSLDWVSKDGVISFAPGASITISTVEGATKRSAYTASTATDRRAFYSMKEAKAWIYLESTRTEKDPYDPMNLILSGRSPIWYQLGGNIRRMTISSRTLT